jgi:hypothetical protein
LALFESWRCLNGLFACIVLFIDFVGRVRAPLFLLLLFDLRQVASFRRHMLGAPFTKAFQGIKDGKGGNER